MAGVGQARSRPVRGGRRRSRPVLGREPLIPPAGERRPIAAYLRAVLREAEGDPAGALGDFQLAVALGLTDADVRDRRDALAARVAP